MNVVQVVQSSRAPAVRGPLRSRE